MVKIYEPPDCNCETCKGHETPPSRDGMPAFGGWRCLCPCHDGTPEGKQRAKDIKEALRRLTNL